MTPTTDDFRNAMALFATGVTVITVDYDGEIQGMTANAFASVSLDPMLVLVCVDQKARTHAHLHAKKRFGINVLSESQQSVAEHFALADREPALAESCGAQFERTKHGTPALRRSLAYLECRLQSAQDAGDHTIFIGQVEEVVMGSGKPLLFFRSGYREIGPELK